MTLEGARLVPEGARRVLRFDRGAAWSFGRGATATVVVEVDGRRFEADWDGRETGIYLELERGPWHDPPGGAIADRDWATIAAAVWALRGEAGGVRAVLEHDAASRTRRALHWDFGDAAVRVCLTRAHMDVLCLGRTMRVGRPPGPPPHEWTFVATRGEARWLLPVPAPVTPDEWAAIVPALGAVGRDDVLFTFEPWRVAVVP